MGDACFSTLTAAEANRGVCWLVHTFLVVMEAREKLRRRASSSSGPVHTGRCSTLWISISDRRKIAGQARHVSWLTHGFTSALVSQEEVTSSSSSSSDSIKEITQSFFCFWLNLKLLPTLLFVRQQNAHTDWNSSAEGLCVCVSHTPSGWWVFSIDLLSQQGGVSLDWWSKKSTSWSIRVWWVNEELGSKIAAEISPQKDGTNNIEREERADQYLKYQTFRSQQEMNLLDVSSFCL